MEDNGNKISLKNELVRKSIHLSSSLVPVSYLFVSRDLAVIVLGISAILFISIDLIRKWNEPFRNFYHKFMGHILREHEVKYDRHVFTGGTYIILAFFLCVLIFPKPLAITAMFVVIFCDSFAAIIGKSKGKHYILNKTLEGSFAFFMSGVIIILLTPKVTTSENEYFLGIAAVFLSTVFELLPLKIDDNISTPLFFGFAYLALMKMFL